LNAYARNWASEISYNLMIQQIISEEDLKIIEIVNEKV